MAKFPRDMNLDWPGKSAKLIFLHFEWRGLNETSSFCWVIFTLARLNLISVPSLGEKFFKKG